MPRIDELTDVQNACLEAAQEVMNDPNRSSLISADDVVAHVIRELNHDRTATIARLVSKGQVSRALRQLQTWKILHREPRDSRGWGLGWYPVYYSLSAKKVHS